LHVVFGLIYGSMDALSREHRPSRRPEHWRGRGLKVKMCQKYVKNGSFSYAKYYI